MSAETLPSRDEALALLQQYTSDERLLYHAYAVEAVMRHMARRYGEDEDKWGLVGLVHDLDWERFPEQHCRKVQEILRERDWPEEIVRAVASHGWGICTDIEPQSDMEKVLYAVDELAGLVVATAVIRPSRSLYDLKPKSVMKKWKVKSFAAGANREVIAAGAEGLGMSVRDLVAEVIEGMRTVAEDIGLAGRE